LHTIGGDIDSAGDFFIEPSVANRFFQASCHSGTGFASTDDDQAADRMQIDPLAANVQDGALTSDGSVNQSRRVDRRDTHVPNFKGILT